MGARKERRSSEKAEYIISGVTERMLKIAEEFGVQIRDRGAWKRDGRNFVLQRLNKYYDLVEDPSHSLQDFKLNFDLNKKSTW